MRVLLQISLNAALSYASLSLFALSANAAEPVRLQAIAVEAAPEQQAALDATVGARVLDEPSVGERTSSSDTAKLIESVPGAQTTGAGAISSQPTVHGFSDDRMNVSIDGLELKPACPNHMNLASSYVDPSRVARITVFAGVAPVSAGGDSLGGAIQIETRPPEFAQPGQLVLVKGRAGGFFRSNGNAIGYDWRALGATGWMSLTYDESSSRSDNYRAARGFKSGSVDIGRDEVASTAIRGATNRSVTLALRHRGHQMQLELQRQTVGFEGFPNQRMDMTANSNQNAVVRYQGQFDWGDLRASANVQDTRHAMDMGVNRFSYGTGMPMNTKQRTNAVKFAANVVASERDVLRVGADFQKYALYDWWPPVGGTMGPNQFFNLDYGRRNRMAAFGEWERQWVGGFTLLNGARVELVGSDAAPVQGYDNGLENLWGRDAAAFNAMARARTDINWDATTSFRLTLAPSWAIEGGYARKSHSPDLYQRFAWSTNAMAALMNNTVGDGNGYVGDVALAPEVASTYSLTFDVGDRSRKRWQIITTGYATQVSHYIDAKRCNIGQCSADNGSASSAFVLLRYTNVSAALVGYDLSARTLVADSSAFGRVDVSAVFGDLRGKNRTTGDNLYNIMPANLKITLRHRLGGWSSTLQTLGVASKHRVSAVRNEMTTQGYVLVHLGTAYEWTHARVEMTIRNLLNAFYSHPLGGAYLGEGPSMTTNGIAWGTTVPGQGRSLDLAFSAFF